MWLALFSAVGLSALLATGGKFGKRQSGIERRYQARNWQARDQLARDAATESGTKSGASKDLIKDLELLPKPS